MYYVIIKVIVEMRIMKILVKIREIIDNDLVNIRSLAFTSQDLSLVSYLGLVK